MKKTLWSRLFVCFLLSGVSFIVLLNTFGMSLLEKKLKDDKMILLSHEAKLIEDEYMTNFFDNTVSPDYLKSQLQSISTFLGITVWVANEEGIVSVDSTNNGIAEQRKLSDLLPNFSDENYTEINSLPGIFSEPMMSYMHSVSYKFSLRGYIILHYPLRGITDEASYYFDIINICFLLFLPLLSFLFLYIYCITAIPLKKLMNIVPVIIIILSY